MGNTDILPVDYILFIQVDVDLEPSPNEVRDTTYVSADELKAMFEQPGLKFTPWFKLICNSMLFEWWSHLGTPALDKYKKRAGHSANVKNPDTVVPYHIFRFHFGLCAVSFVIFAFLGANPPPFTRLMEIYLCTRNDAHDITTF